MASKRSSLAFGLKAHTGWATLVAVAGPLHAPRIVHRARLDLCGGQFPRFAYHEARHNGPGKARASIDEATRLSRQAARQAIRDAMASCAAEGTGIAAAGLLVSSSRDLPALERVLASHAIIHAAEGALYRAALAAGCEACKVPVHGVPERGLWEAAQHALRLDQAALQALLDRLGEAAGRPWAQEQKLAALAALTVLASAGGPAPRARAATAFRPR